MHQIVTQVWVCDTNFLEEITVCLCGVSFQDIENDVYSVLDGHFVIVYIKSWKQVTEVSSVFQPVFIRVFSLMCLVSRNLSPDMLLITYF